MVVRQRICVVRPQYVRTSYEAYPSAAGSVPSPVSRLHSLRPFLDALKCSFAAATNSSALKIPLSCDFRMTCLTFRMRNSDHENVTVLRPSRFTASSLSHHCSRSVGQFAGE